MHRRLGPLQCLYNEQDCYKSLFPSIFFNISVFSLYGEHVARFPLPDGIFLPFDHGLDFLHQLMWEFNRSINQSINRSKCSINTSIMNVQRWVNVEKTVPALALEAAKTSHHVYLPFRARIHVNKGKKKKTRVLSRCLPNTALLLSTRHGLTLPEASPLCSEQLAMRLVAFDGALAAVTHTSRQTLIGATATPRH